MPELPEVEVLARHLRPLLRGKTIRAVEVRREKIARPTTAAQLERALVGAKFVELERRGKYLIFQLRQPGAKENFSFMGHLGMTGRMFLAASKTPLPKHAAVVLDFGRQKFIFEDTRYFGRFTLDLSAVAALGPEPWAEEFTPQVFQVALKRSAQSVKVKLLDQSLVAGVGNIYASEALFRAGISPRRAANRLSLVQAEKLHQTIRELLQEAIDCGSTIPLNFSGEGKRDALFYYGRIEEDSTFYQEQLHVYDRASQPCVNCKTPIKRIVQAARSTYFCPRCQR
jgi:formamidopyrimidine-DNA glycosylase